MDQTKDGKFWVEEIVDFAALYAEKQSTLAAAVDFLVRRVFLVSICAICVENIYFSMANRAWTVVFVPCALGACYLPQHRRIGAYLLYWITFILFSSLPSSFWACSVAVFSGGRVLIALSSDFRKNFKAIVRYRCGMSSPGRMEINFS